MPSSTTPQSISPVAFMKRQMQLAKHIGRKEYAEAICVLEKALTNDPTDVASLIMLAHCHHWLHRDEMAIAVAHQALSYSPNDFQILRLLSDIHFGRAEHDAAAQFVRKGLENSPPPLPSPPKYIFWLLRLLAIVSPRYRKIEESAKQEMSDPDKDTKEWLTWAEQYLSWYDLSHKTDTLRPIDNLQEKN